MKLLLDQGTPRTMAELLRRTGHDAVHTGEIGMAEAADVEILRRADAERRVVVTLDADFHALLALSQANRPSVVRVRIEGLGAREFVVLLQTVIAQCQQDLEAGAVVSVQEHQIRIRHLPLA
jgi:predicted nuclease of predicted toxin-antitoxin system